MYKVKLIYIIIVLPIFVFGQNELEITLTEEETKEDFQLLKNSILNYHPDIYLYTPKSKLDSIFSGIENSLSDMPLMEFY
ncbi:MAG: hypothetical protein VW080_04390, partial [Flavobacteriaceae bacterium]